MHDTSTPAAIIVEECDGDFRHIIVHLDGLRQPNDDYHSRGHGSFDPGPGVADLDVTCQSDRRDSGAWSQPYGWDVRYTRAACIDVRRAKVMYQTLTKIEKALAKSSERYGAAATFGEYLVRVLFIVGIDHVCYRCTDGHMRGELRWMNAGEARYHVEWLIAQWNEQPALTAVAS